ncbi:CYTH domain-containing protein [Staphylococcus hyicus]|uniref:CYTH domain-containing protein n=1 Tax=Staphylococcus hyicus TaxID=1284 RepID=A0A418JIF0_STAHY|nr:CYTH domain-containing protein [Staphylococcus hyicus]MDP4448672.1 CYTH domain-containing protein [Staphylococcus hyicus]MDP4467813.1 CYTH domain-containing protein [Staphylococcus hyicus]NJH81854.1 CYTH domain-containing protein [Staphylococcus hyicus]RIO45483.1 CYTH domain-containing protein [Staphylococcus hyicus]
MAIEQEIEFKQLLDLIQYENIKTTYFSDDEPKTQVNYYIDTPDFQIQSQKMALRIRVKNNNSNEMTLKVPLAIGLNEYNFDTTVVPLNGLHIQEQHLPVEIHNVLQEKHVSFNQLQILGDLKTIRYEKPIEGGLLVLDHSLYLGKEDFELEFEVNDYHKGKQAFETLLNQFQLTHKEPKNKVRRFFEYQAFLKQHKHK